MREIKFRAWDNNAKKMFYDIRLLFANSLNDCFEEYKECGLQIMQYTGLKDKNGVEIYEGDVIEYKDYSGGGVILGGEQPKSKGVIEIENLFDGVKYLSGIARQKGPDVEVVGNIYENPELLEETP